MRESIIKRVLKRFKVPDARNLVESNDKKETFAADFNNMETTSDDYKVEYEVEGEAGVVEPCPNRPNIATCLITLFLMIVFFVLPVVYLFHCFGLLNGNWKNDHNRYDRFEGHNMFVASERRADMNHRERSSKHVEAKTSQGIPPPADPPLCSNVPDALRFDCFPEASADEAGCKARGCCWSPPRRDATTTDVAPYCFYPESYGGYEWLNVTETPDGVVAFLRRTFRSPYPGDVAVVRVDARYETRERLRVRIVDPARSRFEPPVPEVPVVGSAPPPPTTDYRFVIDRDRIGFAVVRRSDGSTVFDARNVGALVFADQFLQISALLPSHYVYGLGEHRSAFLLSTHWQRFVMWNHDSVPKENTNLYGSHPFYMGVEESGLSHGVFLLNSNAMEVILQPSPAVTFRTVGGILDLFFLMGPQPSDVARQYTGVVGTPHMPPYWALGFHLCRFGYKSLANTRAATERTRQAGIPLDVQWNDLDYMDDSKDFTYDRVAFAGLPGFVDELHARGMKYTVLVDPGVSAGERPGSYPPYDRGLALGIFVKNSSGLPFEGKVWNRVSTVWPDFTHPSTVDYWTQQLGSLHAEVPFDGAWIDMNEPSNFYSGTRHGCPQDNTLDRPPYLPAVEGGSLAFKTLCASSLQHAGAHYDLHNLYGLTEAIVTRFAMAEVRGRRPLVISRSTFPGHGRYAGHWTGDVASSWADMRASVAQLLTMNLLGVPLTGADVCGFNGNTTAELCARWSQLGAFYPFSRNHNTDDAVDQDPAALGGDVAASARASLRTRYSLLPYLYTLFYDAHVDGSPVVRPLLAEFPRDPRTYAVDAQFMWGRALMVAPVLDPGATSVEAYLPDAVWYDFRSGAELPATSGGGATRALPAPPLVVPLLLRGGCVVPMQGVELTTTASRLRPLELVAAPDERGHAHGSLFWDDGDSLGTVVDGRYNLLRFALEGAELSGSVERWGHDRPMTLGRVTVLGVGGPVGAVYLNGTPETFSYDTVNKVLLLQNLTVSMKDAFNVRWV